MTIVAAAAVGVCARLPHVRRPVEQMTKTQSSRGTCLALHRDTDIIAGRTGALAWFTTRNIVGAGEFTAATNNLPVGEQHLFLFDRRLQGVIRHEGQVLAQRWCSRTLRHPTTTNIDGSGLASVQNGCRTWLLKWAGANGRTCSWALWITEQMSALKLA